MSGFCFSTAGVYACFSLCFDVLVCCMPTQMQVQCSTALHHFFCQALCEALLSEPWLHVSIQLSNMLHASCYWSLLIAGI